MSEELKLGGFLKPCPFCGEGAFIASNGSVCCGNEYCRAMIDSAGAVDKWNAREVAVLGAEQYIQEGVSSAIICDKP